MSISIATTLLLAVVGAAPQNTVVDVQLDAATRVRLQAQVVVRGPAAAGKPSEAFFVKVDRSTMTQAGLGENFALLARALPSACDAKACDLRFSLDGDSYKLAGEPGTYEVTPTKPEFKYVAIRRM